jgi:hypothetical protein
MDTINNDQPTAETPSEQPAKRRGGRPSGSTNATTSSRKPSVKLDVEASSYVDAVVLLNQLPHYEGPTTQQVIDAASKAASKAVVDLYANLMSKAKVR